MKEKKKKSLDFILTLYNRDKYLESVTKDSGDSKSIRNLFLMMLFFSFIYGLVMGGYHSFPQAISSGVKVAALFSLVIFICFPAFFMIQYILGSRLNVYQMSSIILSGFVLTTSIMVSLAPIIVFFLITGSNYYFLQLLHVSVFIFSGLFGINTVVEALKYSCEKKSIYPKTGVTVFKFWVIILAFVGMQLAWSFRPFLGDRGLPYKTFREYEGNFYTAIIYSVKKLFESENNEQRSTKQSHKDERLIVPFDLDSLNKGK